MRRILLATLVALLILAACRSSPAPSPSAAQGGSGFVEVALEVAPDASEFFASQHRARVVAADGTLVGDWEITDAAAPMPVPAGAHRLEAFTVFLSDFIQCSADPANPGKEHCAAPTLGPVHVCAIPIEVVAGATVRATFRTMPEGECQLLRVADPVPTASPSVASAGATATLFLTAAGYPPGSLAYGGFRLQAHLVDGPTVVAEWDPWLQDAVAVAPGSYDLILDGDPYSDMRSADEGPAGPHMVVCRMPIELAAGTRQVFVDLGAGGPVCRTTEPTWPPAT